MSRFLYLFWSFCSNGIITNYVKKSKQPSESHTNEFDLGHGEFTELNELNIPQVDNASLFILENDDNDIKERAEKMENLQEKSWLVFNKYAESLTTDVYASLDEVDLNHIKLIHDLTNETKKKITNVHTDRFFQGNINQKLFVKCLIRNPLTIPIHVSSIKLYCTLSSSVKYILTLLFFYNKSI